MQSRIVHRRRKSLYRDAVRTVHMRPYNVWAVRGAGVRMVRANQYQIRPPHMVDRSARRSAKSIFVDRRRVEGLFSIYAGILNIFICCCCCEFRLRCLRIVAVYYIIDIELIDLG